MIQLSLVVAVQLTPGGAETFNEASVPTALKAPLIGENVVSAMSVAAFTFSLPKPNTLLGHDPLLLHNAELM